MSAADKTKKLTEIFDHYFDEDNFKSPAIDNKESFENAFSNPDNTIKTAWEEIKANKKAIRFSHREGYEGLISIAFSPLNKKAIPVSYSD